VGREAVWLLRRDQERDCYWATYPTDFQRISQEDNISRILSLAARLLVKDGERSLDLPELSFPELDLSAEFVKVGLDSSFLSSEFLDSGCESLGHHEFSCKRGRAR
jgi:hypothetical protein